MTAAISFLIGVCLASFIMVLSESSTKLWRRSHCDGCHQPLRWHQLIPVISSWFLRPRCSNCNHCPTLIYGSVEMLIGVLFALTAVIQPFDGTLILIDSFILISLHISLWDWRYKQIPVVDLILLTLLTVLYLLIDGCLPISSLLMLGLLTVLLTVWCIRRKSFPLASGDWILLTIASGWLIPESLPAFLTITGGFGVLTALLYKYCYQEPCFPFAPAILGAAWICLIVYK